MEASPDAFSVVLFNMMSSETGVKQQTRNGNMEVMLGRVLDEMPTPLFILCQEGLNCKREKDLTSKLRLWGFEAKFAYTDEAGIVCVWKSGAVWNSVRFVQNATLQHTLREVTVDENGNTVETNFKVDRLKACVIQAGRRKILLISWHGPNKPPLAKKREAFRMLVRFSECLRVQESCEVVMLGGDFNLPVDHARAGMAEFNEYHGTVCDDYQKPTDIGQLKDYIVYWPKDQLLTPCTRPDFRSILEKGSRPFDHPVVGYRFEDYVYKRLNRQGPRTRRIAEIISEIAKARRPSALPLRLCLHVQQVSGLFSDGKVGDKALCRLLPDLTFQRVITEEDDVTLFLAIGKEERRKEYEDQMKAISISGLLIGCKQVPVEFYYSSVWNPIPQLNNVNPSCLFCIWCRCCTTILDFDTSVQSCPEPALPWIGNAPRRLRKRVTSILRTRSEEEEDIHELYEEFDHLMDLLTMRTQDVTYEEFEDIANDWAEALLQMGERFEGRDVIDTKRIAECVKTHLPSAYEVVLKLKRSRSQAASAGSSGTGRGGSGGSRLGGARTAKDMSRQGTANGNFHPTPRHLTSRVGPRSEAPIRRRSHDDDSPLWGVVRNKQSRLDGRSQAASAGSSGTGRGGSAGSRSGEARSATDMSRQGTANGNFHPKPRHLTSRVGPRPEAAIRRRSHDDDSPLWGVVRNKQSRLDGRSQAASAGSSGTGRGGCAESHSGGARAAKDMNRQGTIHGNFHPKPRHLTSRVGPRSEAAIRRRSHDDDSPLRGVVRNKQSRLDGRSQAASTGSSGTGRGASGGSRSGGARTATDMSRQGRVHGNFHPTPRHLTSRVGHRSEAPIRRRSHDDDSPLWGVVRNKQSRLDGLCQTMGRR